VPKNNETQQSCAIYCRFSSKQQEGNFSIEAQKSACLDYAHKQNWKIYRIFEDRALSGTSDERDAFQEVIRLSTETPPPFTVLLVHKLDRFARNRYDSVKYKYLLRKKGIRVLSVTQPMVGVDGPTEVLMESLLEGMDEFYSLNLARETIKGMTEAAKQGFWCHGRSPYGYQKKILEQNGHRRAKLIIENKEAGIVERIYKRYARGDIGIKGLAMELNNRGNRPRTGKYFTKGHIEHILGSEKYAGDMIFGKELNTGARPFRPLQEPITVKNSHPAIISRELDAKVKNILKRRNPGNNPPRIHNDSYLLSSLIICGRCGARYIGVSGKSGKYHYYMCGTKSRKGKIACDSPEYNRSKLEDKIIEQIKKHIITKENIYKLAIELFEATKAAIPDIAKKAARAEIDIRNKEGKLQRLYEVLETSKDLNADDLAPRMRELKAEIQEAQTEKEILENEIKQTKEAKINTKWIKSYAQMLIDVLGDKSFYARKSLLSRIIDKIQIKNKGCEITFRPFIDTINLPIENPAKRKPGSGKTPEFSQKKYWLPPYDSNVRPGGYT